jgi:very-short-patch-repair endonuclease
VKNQAHILFEKHLAELRLKFARESLFHPTRKWRWDYVLLDSNVAIEIQGGFYRGKGGHNSINGMQRDMDKLNAGVMLGWRVLHFSTADVLTGRAKAFLAEHLK